MAKGKVYLTGAGPGDLSLLTLRAAELIESCDVLVYDYLANPLLTTWTRDDCECICVGKQKGRHSIPQEQIEKILVEKASEGKSVVRLKGGDPFIFGRGGEEAERLRAAGLDFEIIPGVSAALGAAACTGIPLTHRLHSSSVCFLTGHEDVQTHALHNDFAGFARTGGTLCIYMGVSTLERIAGELLAGGLPSDTPAALVQWATLPRQRSLQCSLGELSARARDGGFGAPAVIIVGAVARSLNELNWFEQRPLFGRRVVVTRSREQAGELSERLQTLGAEVLELPLIHVSEFKDEVAERETLQHITQYQWLVFTSPNGVRYFFQKLFRAHRDIRVLGGLSIACVGPSTAREVRRHHIAVDFVPEKATAEALAESLMQEHDLEHYNVLVVTGSRNRDVLVKQLHEGRAIVDTLQAYETLLTELADEPAAARFRTDGADAITFTSSSTVDSFVDQAGNLKLADDARRPKTVSIGPVTSARMKEKGLPVDAEAKEHTLDGLIAALRKLLDR